MDTPTIYDVSRLSGVSTATVSRAFTAPDRVREETRRKVLAAAEALVRQDIADCVETHSGQWANLRKPTTEMEQFVHMCVYLATRPECTVRLPISASYYQR